MSPIRSAFKDRVAPQSISRHPRVSAPISTETFPAAEMEQFFPWNSGHPVFPQSEEAVGLGGKGGGIKSISEVCPKEDEADGGEFEKERNEARKLPNRPTKAKHRSSRVLQIARDVGKKGSPIPTLAAMQNSLGPTSTATAAATSSPSAATTAAATSAARATSKTATASTPPIVPPPHQLKSQHTSRPNRQKARRAVMPIRSAPTPEREVTPLAKRRQARSKVNYDERSQEESDDPEDFVKAREYRMPSTGSGDSDNWTKPTTARKVRPITDLRRMREEDELAKREVRRVKRERKAAEKEERAIQRAQKKEAKSGKK